jgi:glycosyltransferase involved in cell wall biosynthesis
MWKVLSEFPDRHIVVWLHGAEIQPWYRRSFNYSSDSELEAAKVASSSRISFWRGVVDAEVPNLHLVFVSQYLADEVMEDLDRVLTATRYSVVHNPIDTETFRYEPKVAGQRHKILSIRPYASRKYANDLAVAAVLELAGEEWFEQLQFRFVGDGKLFEETLAPLRSYPNVTIDRGYLTHSQLASLHRQYGVVLIPTRADTQGVSRDEAMAAGLVPVTSAVTAVPEFVSEEEGILAPYDDHHGLAAGIAKLHHDPDEYLRMSAASAKRVRSQSSSDKVIHHELQLIGVTS